MLLALSNCRRNHRQIDKKSVEHSCKIFVMISDSLTEQCIGVINQSNSKGKDADTTLSQLKALNLSLKK